MDDKKSNILHDIIKAREEALKRSESMGDADWINKNKEMIQEIRKRKALSDAFNKDIKNLSEDEIKALLQAGEDIPYFQDISNPTMDQARFASEEIVSQEPKLYRTLSDQINENSKLGTAKIPEITEEIAGQMKLGYTPDVKYEYGPFYGAVKHGDNKTLYLNPQGFSKYGREGVIAHEIRHMKDINEGWTIPFIDDSNRNLIYGGTQNDPLREMLAQSMRGKADQRETGKSLHNFIKKNDRLFPADKLKPKVDALELYDFIERKHFKDSFLKRNLKRLAKGLPLIGAALTLSSEEAAASPTELLDPFGSTSIDTDYRETPEYADAMKKVYKNIQKRRRNMQKRGKVDKKLNLLKDVTLK